jgi:hypothetical protein
MNDLLKKLNTLAKAKLNDLTPNLPSFERTPNLDRQVNDLRQRINEALDHEDQLQRNAQALRDEVGRLDTLADEAVANGRDADARYLLDQLKRAEQRLTIAESELRAHQRSAEELIQRVNMLEATLADAKAEAQNAPLPPLPVRSAPSRPVVQQPPAQSEPSVSQPRQSIPIETESSIPSQPPAPKQTAPVEQTAQPQTSPQQPVTEEEQSPAERYAAPVRENAQEQAEKTRTAVEQVSDMLREAQEKTQSKIEALGEMLNAGMPTDPAAAPVPTEDASDNSVMMPRPKKNDDSDDDLAQRLRRLSKPE